MATTPRTTSLWQRPNRLFTALFCLFSLLFSSFYPAQASLGGTESRNTPFSIGYTFKLGGVEQVCSGALISPTIIVTAAHCVVDEMGNSSSDYIFAAPGTALDSPIDPSAKRPTFVKVFTVPNYILTTSNESDDIAFIQLNMPIATKGFIRVATAAEVAGLTDKLAIQGYGFGDVFETNALYSTYTRTYPIQWNANFPMSKTVPLTSPNSSACSGDSGGAVTAKLPSGEEVLIAAMSGAANVVNRCGTQVNGLFNMRVTVINSYLYLISDILKTSLATPSPKPIAKTYKITCVKGKKKKYLTGVNPKCPSGYKLTAKVLVKK